MSESSSSSPFFPASVSPLLTLPFNPRLELPPFYSSAVSWPPRPRTSLAVLFSLLYLDSRAPPVALPSARTVASSLSLVQPFRAAFFLGVTLFCQCSPTQAGQPVVSVPFPLNCFSKERKVIDFPFDSPYSLSSFYLSGLPKRAPCAF